MWFILFTISCFAFSSILFVVFKSKQHISNIDNQLFTKVSLATAASTLVELILEFMVKNQPNSIISNVFAKLYLIFVTIWFTIFSVYVFYILRFKNNKYFKQVRNTHSILFIIVTLLYFFTPIKIFYENNVMYSFGPAVTLLKGVISIYIASWIILSIINHKQIFKKSYIPILGVYILITANLIAQSIDPSLTLVSFTLTIVIYLMYFTIENPDLKMINELYKNKNIMEQTYVDKSNFLFEMTQEVRNPMFNIKKICSDVKDSNNINDYKAAINKINLYSKELDYLVNDILNVNSLDSMQIKFIESKYNFDLIINEIISKAKDTIPKDVKFNYEIEKDIPSLYGDGIKLKQIVSSLLLNSIERTETGFIDLRVDTIKRFDALRLIIQIKDSSGGIPIDIVNDILNTTASLNPKEVELLEKNDINIELCQKVIKLMGGNLLIKSGNKKGTEIVLTLDQRIDEVKDEANAFEKYIDKSKKVAIVNQDKKLNDYLKKIFTANDINPTILLNGLNLIDQIKMGKKYEYIIVSNNMKSINGYTIYQKLKEIEGFNTPVMIMIEKESLKKHLKDEGFSEVLLLNNIGEEINKVIDKY